MSLQSGFSNPVEVSIGVTPWREDLRVARQLAPADAALVEAGIHDLRQRRERDHRLAPGHVLHVPVEVVDRAHDLVVGAGALHALGVRDDAEGIHADRELLEDPRVVLVVARLGLQLRDADAVVAHLELVRLPRADHEAPGRRWRG
jgi:hypothetical protein